MPGKKSDSRERTASADKDLPANVGKTYDELLSYNGLALVISSLDNEEKKILHAACQEKNGITFAEIEKQLKLDTRSIEQHTEILVRRLLVYVFKNRQKLSNKLDKIYIVPEIRNLLNPLDNNFFKDYFSDIANMSGSGSISKCRTVMQSIKEPELVVLRYLFSNGGVVTLEDFNNNFQQKSPQKLLHDLIEDKYINVYHDLNQSGRTLVILNKKLFIGLSVYHEKNTKVINVHNRYNLLLNLLNTYDIVSTYGLFLTKRKEFRKIDRKHLSDIMILLSDADGNELHHGELSQLSLYLLSIQNITAIKDDSLILSLKKIAHLLDEPSEWLSHIIKLLHDFPEDKDLLLNSPFKMPESRDLLENIDLINTNESASYKYLQILFFLRKIIRTNVVQFEDINRMAQNTNAVFKNSMKFLSLSGIIEVEKSLIKLSDIGISIAKKFKLIEAVDEDESVADKNQKDLKKIYLNSDFMLMIPKEIPSEALYHLSTHTETVIDDVILQTRITRESILTSLKRGMKNEKFFETLDKYLKTDIPGNLNFLISEWTGQTIRLAINNATVLHTNQSSFIDKILHSKIKNSIIKRISESYALIDRRYLDKIIKMGKENDAVINLFDETEDLN